MIIKPVGFWKRLIASILDAAIIGVPLAIISYLFTGDWEGDWLTSSIQFLYSLILPVIWMGYTIGKRILGIRIVKVNGEKVGFGTMVLRIVIASLIYLVTLGLGMIVSAFMVGFRRDKRALHDFIAGTYVTSEQA